MKTFMSGSLSLDACSCSGALDFFCGGSYALPSLVDVGLRTYGLWCDVQETYDMVRVAYDTIFERMKLPVVRVEVPTHAIATNYTKSLLA